MAELSQYIRADDAADSVTQYRTVTVTPKTC